MPTHHFIKEEPNDADSDETPYSFDKEAAPERELEALIPEVGIKLAILLTEPLVTTQVVTGDNRNPMRRSWPLG
ncbi:uncharacterized protein G2W53_000958 [Senna tora]|uniref:Uncharacterized protein n=1 Tax=Senna tora TaxID=362788 RepID=A0A834XGB7_9FABA|nr:uncharacterized protein G2W53_000958 [Senna tora]